MCAHARSWLVRTGHALNGLLARSVGSLTRPRGCVTAHVCICVHLRVCFLDELECIRVGLDRARREVALGVQDGLMVCLCFFAFLEDVTWNE